MKGLVPLTLISLLFIIYRMMSVSMDGVPVNSAPLAALFFCAVYYAGIKGVIVSVAIWLLSYPLLSAIQGYGIGNDLWASLLGFSVILGSAFLMKKSILSGYGKKELSVIFGSLGGAVIFYFLTNGLSWLGMPIYEKTWQGFAQAQWLGHPDFPLPTWVFLRNSLLGNGVFLILFLSAQSTPSLKFMARVFKVKEEKILGEI